MATVRIIGPGRAGSSLSEALCRAGWHVVGTRSVGPTTSRGAARGVDVLVIATPDDAVADVAAACARAAGPCVAPPVGIARPRRAGAPPPRAALHPLVPLPNAEVGAARLAGGVTFAVAGDAVAAGMADASAAGRSRWPTTGPGRLPRGGLHRGQPRGGPARPGGAGGGLRRARRSTPSWA